MTTASIIIPVFNEQNIIGHSISEIERHVQNIDIISDYELVVDDGSSDGTWQCLESLAEDNHRLKTLRLTRNFGKESALCAALERVDSEITIVIDADLQHPPALISKMVDIWSTENVDIVEAVKSSRGEESKLSKFTAHSFYKVFSSLSGIDMENASDFKLLDRKVVRAWRQLPERNLFFRGMSAWVGFNKKEITFDVEQRVEGDSKWSLFALIRLALTSITAYSSAPLHIISALGAIFTSLAIVIGSYTLYLKIIGEAVSGFTTVIILLLVIGGIIMIALGVIGLYIARIFDEVKQRPRYLIMDTRNIK
jgi:dolichol-phosphate mannosyltransferase